MEAVRGKRGREAPMFGMRVATTALRERPRMEELAEEARRRARELGRPVLVSITTAAPAHDPLALFARARGATHNRFFWSVPSSGLALAGLGAAWSVETAGPGRIGAARAAWGELVASAAVDRGENLPFAGPVAAAGFAFDPLRDPSGDWAGFPEGLLLLPRIMLARQGERASLTLNGLVGPDTSTAALAAGAARRLSALIGRGWRHDDRPAELGLADALDPDAWRTMVARAEAELRAGAMEKVVLARAVRAESGRPLDIPGALERLRHDYPDTFVFAVARGGRTFLGASPERLVSLRGGVVSAHGLAGSARRGATPEEDERFGAALLGSAKDRAEHEVVVRTIVEELAGLATDIAAPAEPTLMKVRNVQHLFTPISARIVPGHTVLDLVERLHPTPAVGGRPSAPALQWIRANERLDRGWYAGPVGWIDAAGEGEFAVGLRSALTSRLVATLYAGCGIVAGSDPEREFQESQIKLRAMLGALAGE